MWCSRGKGRGAVHGSVCTICDELRYSKCATEQAKRFLHNPALAIQAKTGSNQHWDKTPSSLTLTNPPGHARQNQLDLKVPSSSERQGNRAVSVAQPLRSEIS